MKNLKKQEGITLVALVVTIVVLLILAGITIMYVLSDNGIFGKAQSAATETTKATAKESVALALMGVQADIADPNVSVTTSSAATTFASYLPSGITGSATFTDVTIADFACTGTVTVDGTTYSFTYADGTLTFPTADDAE